MGFCNHHDTITFKSIETGEYDKLPEQNFYYAYRAFCFESHKKLEQIHGFNNLVKQLPQMLERPHIVEQYKQMKLSEKDIYENQSIFKQGLIKSHFSTIHTDIYEYNYPTKIAVSCGFYLLSDLDGKEINKYIIYNKSDYFRTKFLYLTIFPQGKKTYILLSCLKEDFDEYESLFSQIKELNRTIRAQFFSKIAILKSQNVVFNPNFWDKLDHKYKANINEDMSNIMNEDYFDGIENFIDNETYNFFQYKI